MEASKIIHIVTSLLIALLSTLMWRTLDTTQELVVNMAEIKADIRYTVDHAADGHPTTVQKELVEITNALAQRLIIIENTLQRHDEEMRDAR